MTSQEPSDLAHLMTNVSVVAVATVLRATTKSGVPQQVREKGKHGPVSITVRFYIFRSADIILLNIMLFFKIQFIQTTYTK